MRNPGLNLEWKGRIELFEKAFTLMEGFCFLFITIVVTKVIRMCVCMCGCWLYSSFIVEIPVEKLTSE